MRPPPSLCSIVSAALVLAFGPSSPSATIKEPDSWSPTERGSDGASRLGPRKRSRSAGPPLEEATPKTRRKSRESPMSRGRPAVLCHNYPDQDWWFLSSR